MKKIKNRQAGDSRYIYENEFHKACFQLEMDYWGFKNLNWRTIADKVLRDRAFNITKN